MIVVKEISFCCGHRLMNHEGLCRNIHGHNYRVMLMVSGGIEKRSGMVLDFKRIKEVAEERIKNVFDHALVLNCHDPLGDWFDAFDQVGGALKIIKMDGEPTAENMAREFLHVLPEVDGIRVYETETSYAEEWRQ